MSKFDVKALKGLTLDSRQVKDGYLFGAFPGATLDGRDYIEAAIQNGAVAVLAPEGTVLPGLGLEKDVELMTDENPRRLFAQMAAEFYGQQPKTIVAVTGTNGKTSCVYFVKQLWGALEFKAASIGTLGVRGPEMIKSASMTTPDPVSLQGALADMAAVGITHLAMEASSHGLDQYRLDGVKVSAAAFTNLSRDHLDYHGDMESYFAAKARLFSELVVDGGTAVLNADIEEFAKLKDIAEARGLKIISFGEKGEQLKLLETTPHTHGQHVVFEAFGEHVELDLPLVGNFQVMNVLCSLGLVLAADHKWDNAFVAALENLQGAPGRLQLVKGHPVGAAVYVDYAHTPDALQTVLEALRPHTPNKLSVVFGCGGDRDRGKRPMMGEIAEKFADSVIVTDDNPRNEKASLIRADVMKGTPSATEVGDRAEAINEGIKVLSEGDVLVIAGKGHEQGQIFADHTAAFDDYEEAEKAISQLREATKEEKVS
ncbi:MAG: UDP-N-acetylmuramoyl-L-alanyl-D-glutamate--2,6-diaminopimelate ligase [Pseudomonadota bacterium]